MNDKLLAQVERMKEQTIGVEVEMYNIGRKKAIGVVAKHYGTRSSIIHEGGAYDKWTCLDNQGRKWSMVTDSSIQSTTRASQAEMTTPILNYSDIEDLQEIIRALRKAGAKSDPAHSCGVHIHIGANGHTPKSLRNMVNMMAAYENILIDSINIDRGRVGRWCKAVDQHFLEELNKKKPTTMSDFADVWYSTQGGGNRSAHYNYSRYHMLNLHATFTKGTIEFRCFQFDNPSEERKGGLHAGQLKSYIQLCLALSEQAKSIKSASCKKQQDENPKYSMRTYLLRIGFIGDEFKTAREILTKRLSGDAAFRKGRAAA